jgi:formate dehydrogenase subunit gamma
MSAHEDLVKVTDGIERVVHWILAGSCLFCLISGIGFMFHSWSFIATFFGGYYAMKWMHIFSGAAFACAFVYSYFMWKKDCYFEPQDLDWVLKGGGYLWPVENLPPVYKYNAGQKAFFWILVACAIAIIASGFIMVNPLIYPWVVIPRLAYMLHAGAVVLLGSFIVVHIYLGTAGNPGTVSAMLSGYVTRAWCETHCPRWLEERDNWKPEGMREDNAA